MDEHACDIKTLTKLYQNHTLFGGDIAALVPLKNNDPGFVRRLGEGEVAAVQAVRRLEYSPYDDTWGKI